MVRSFARLVLLACIVSALSAGSLGAVVAYHGQDGNYHQAQWDALVPQGYRLISLSIYGDPSSPVYAAVWIQRVGPAFVGAHGIDGSEYQDLFDTYTPLGYVPTIISACGDNGAEARYACFFEQLNPGGVAGVHGATEQTYRDQNTWARDNNYRLVWVDIYGTAGNPLYCASWVPNNAVQAWNYSVGESGADYQKRYDAYDVQWIRPALTSVSAAVRYTSIWVDDVLPGGYVALHGLSPQQYQDAFDFWTGEGLIPIRVDAGGEGNDARFAAIFANTDLPMAREWYVTGFPTTGLDDFDTAMLDFMQEKGIRGGALAITKDCRLVLARGYTWAEPGYPVTQPDNLFRIASCSKPITGIGIMQLVEEGRLGLDEDIVDVVNMTTLPGESWHSFLDDVRIRDLLVHAGGWDIGETGLNYDPMFHNIEVRDAVGGTLPITKYQIELYMNGQPMQFFPGSDSIYSNYGFSLLGQAIEVRRSSAAFLTYEQAIKAYVFNPLGVTRPRIGRTLQGLAAPGEVRYHGIRPSISSSVMSEDRPWLPTQYGGYNVENFDAHGGWIMAAPDFAKVMSAFDDDGGVLMDGDTLDALLRDSTGFGNTRRGWFRGTTADGVVAYGHNGSIHASSAMQWWREDKISFTVFFNKDVSPALWFSGHTLGDDLNKIAGELNSSGDWPDNDWFGRLGLPTCVPSPTPTPTNTPRPTSTPTNTPRITNTPTPSSTPTGTPGPGFRWGDMDDSGVTGTLDAALILQWDVFLIDDFPCCPGVTRPSYPPRADVSDDGTLGAVDASQILQWDAFLLNCFPADTDCDEFGPE